MKKSHFHGRCVGEGGGHLHAFPERLLILLKSDNVPSAEEKRGNRRKPTLETGKK
ncbi:MAG: hypothetical protein QXN56_04170 [Candidatus Hadarchaeum sp.]